MDPSVDLTPRSDQILPHSAPAPSDDVHYAFAGPTPATILLPSISRLAPPTLRPPKVRRRPSTASSAEEKRDLLPPARSMGDLTPSACSPISDAADFYPPWVPNGKSKDRRSVSHEDRSIQDMNRKAHAAVAGLRAEASRLTGLGES